MSSSAEVPSAELFSRDINYFKDGNLTILDYNRKNCLLFSQGDWSLIRRDLELAGISPECISTLETSKEKHGLTHDGDSGEKMDQSELRNKGAAPCEELLAAFRVRRELIHYKKLTLHLFEEARRIERELKSCISFFFWFDSDFADSGIQAHLEAICEESNKDGSSFFLSPNSSHSKLMKEVSSRHFDPDSCSLLDRKRIYVLATGIWLYHRGISRVIHDARDFTKAIVMTPRHPDGEKNGERPWKLEHLPSSMMTLQACETAEREFREPPKHSSPTKTNDMIQSTVSEIQITENQDTNSTSKSNEDCHNRTTKKQYIPKGWSALQRILERVRNELSWPKEAVIYLEKSIIARGGFKALAIVEELENYLTELEKLPQRIEAILHLYKEKHLEGTQHFVRCGYENARESDLSSAVHMHRQVNQLTGLSKACKENTKWISTIAKMVIGKSNSNSGRLFVAGDDLDSMCAFVPQGFELGNYVSLSRQLLDEILNPAMRLAAASESWPPSKGSRRTRVLAFDSTTIEFATIGRKKLHHCTACQGLFDSRWIRRKICSICEDKKRISMIQNDELDRCIFEDCKLPSSAFCPHVNRCFICDTHTCEKCRLLRGNGEVATSIVETIQPEFLLLDFDRTLCSTKSGASPLPSGSRKQRKKSRHDKESNVHTIDNELRTAIAAQHAYGSSHIVTRNSHKDEIKEFLLLNGLHELANNVNVVPKKKSKGSFIKETFYDNNTGGSKKCLFIDDDIRELVNDPWMRNDDRVHRLLFVRAML